MAFDGELHPSDHIQGEQEQVDYPKKNTKFSSIIASEYGCLDYFLECQEMKLEIIIVKIGSL